MLPDLQDSETLRFERNSHVELSDDIPVDQPAGPGSPGSVIHTCMIGGNDV